MRERRRREHVIKKAEVNPVRDHERGQQRVEAQESGNARRPRSHRSGATRNVRIAIVAGT